MAITGFYAYQNYRMANEMRAAREVSVLPKLSLHLGMVAPTLGFIYLSNVGPGAALDIDISVVFVPRRGASEPTVTRRWSATVMAPGETHHFFPERRTETQAAGEGETLRIEALVETYAEVRLDGSYRDALGKAHAADDTLGDLSEWWRLQVESGVAWQHPDPDYRLANTLVDRFKQKFNTDIRAFQRELKELRRAVSQLTPTRRDDEERSE